MNLTYLTDEQVLDLYEEIQDAYHLLLSSPSGGWSHSQTEHVRFKLRTIGIHDIPEATRDIYIALRDEKKDRQF